MCKLFSVRRVAHKEMKERNVRTLFSGEQDLSITEVSYDDIIFCRLVPNKKTVSSLLLQAIVKNYSLNIKDFYLDLKS